MSVPLRRWQVRPRRREVEPGGALLEIALATGAGKRVRFRPVAGGWEVSVGYPDGTSLARRYARRKEALVALACLTVDWMPFQIVRYLVRQ